MRIASFSMFAINRFANISVHVYDSTVRGRPSQLYIGFAIWPYLTGTQLLNYAIKTRPTVPRICPSCIAIR